MEYMVSLVSGTNVRWLPPRAGRTPPPQPTKPSTSHIFSRGILLPSIVRQHRCTCAVAFPLPLFFALLCTYRALDTSATHHVGLSEVSSRLCVWVRYYHDIRQSSVAALSSCISAP